MECANCKVYVSTEFAFAISSNKCPACGKKIVNTNSMASFMPLRKLLGDNLGSETAPELIEKITTLVISNFDVCEKNAASKIVQNDIAPDIEKDQIVVNEDGIRLEPFDKIKSKAILQKMRDDVLAEAISDQTGIEFSEEVLLSENPIANAELLKQEQKRHQAQNAVITGAAGGKGFRRA